MVILNKIFSFIWSKPLTLRNGSSKLNYVYRYSNILIFIKSIMTQPIMKIKRIITEAVITDTIIELETELNLIKSALIEHMICEGVDDPGILKCVFMSGSAGSGKGFVSAEIFGIDQRFKNSFSQTGLKVVNSDAMFEKLLKKNGIDPKDLATIEKTNAELWNTIAVGKNSIRSTAKKLTQKQKSFYEAGRLGLIIDGTGHEYSKIKTMKEHAELLGYDTYMVFVNTSLEVAQERNLQRSRTLPADIVAKSWNDVQANLSKFHSLFGGSFQVVDNTSIENKEHTFKFKDTNKKIVVKQPVDQQIHKAIASFLRRPVQNPIGKDWITTARILKNSKLIK